MAMKGNKLYSILRMKCPKCHEGDLFEDKNPYHLKKIAAMPEKCPHCGESFSREPGFYFGAAYVSYGLTVALWIAILIALLTFNALGWIEYGFFSHPVIFIVTDITSLILLLPLIYRLSRSIWISMFVKYDEEAGQAQNQRA
ncbi:MAG: DUF983 domain-containing protein [Flavobacteriales bacterium]|nr:DUF983 domain-containing protein [Flavobacteriales bacterium]